ncbi:MAG: dihydrolipoyl dehydrogenase [Rhodospirillaceae bacterium]|jgi:dihydrolipoamide dehydrogenase|nr:dihydrolipoyl dehydrogenase [Rhodospirillaceae bacterium]MBT4220318.1 dihydrolipoyl dehydrogenase [Rhodospirillaceae bacterium]MBT4464810.1 dihydrolipoyl dehydrogenase [Rhodospirillaceae bacterium]MBT6406560.1 dihydrolipoyl dehydrogenase [Rhodospirillaceae bacterium]
MADTNFDLIVIGGGPGGYVSAIRAAQLKMKVALVEREHLGGICLNWGCIPTKALLRSAEVYENIKHAEAYGVSAGKPGFDLKKIVERSRSVANQLNGGVGHLLKKNKVTVFDGAAKLAGAGKVQVGKTTLSAKHIILATGARARTLPGLEPDGKLVWTYKDALVPDDVPKKLLVVGSGAIGIEFASFFNSLGSDVTVVEVMDRVLPVEDAEISGLAHKAFEGEGMTIMTSATVKALKKGKNSVTATVEAGGKSQDINVDRVILAVGIVGNTEDLGLEGTKVKVDRTHIETDEWCRTGEPGVYAIGDIAGAPWLAHKASHEGIICVEKIAGLKDVHPLDTSRIPGCTYCRPQVASVGMTEQAAKDAGHTVKVGRFPFMGNGKAIALGEPEGLVKTVFDAKTGELLGAHMIGAEVTELIQGYGIAKTLETTEADLMHTVFPHPTLSEMMHESVLDAFGRAIHF